MTKPSLFDRDLSPASSTIDQAGLDVSRIINMLFQHLDTQVTIADNKANIVVAINAVLLTALGLSQPTIQRLLDQDPLSLSAGTALVVLLMMLFSSLASILYAIDAARPKLIRPREAANLFFFGDVAALDPHEYEQAFLRQDVNAIKGFVFQQIHARSRVVAAKFVKVRRSMNLLFVAAMLWSLAQVLLVI